MNSPRMVDRILGTGDKETAQLIDLICSEEVSHVHKGIKWFSFVCNELQVDVEKHFQENVRKYVPGGELLPPFNIWAREQAGMEKKLYIGVSAERKTMETKMNVNTNLIAQKRDKFKSHLENTIMKSLDED